VTVIAVLLATRVVRCIDRRSRARVTSGCYVIQSSPVGSRVFRVRVKSDRTKRLDDRVNNCTAHRVQT
jgi:hypothetical protein